MLGSADDIKRDIAYLLNGQAFIDSVAAVVADNQDGFVPKVPVTIYQEERLSHLVFPMCELIAYKETFVDPDDVVKHSEVALGARWTDVARDEHTVTRYIEVLCKATVDVLWGAYLRRVQSQQVLIHEVDYGPLVPTAQHPYLKAGIVLFTVHIWRS